MRAGSNPAGGTHDDLGHLVNVLRPARRVVSLVPSLTESIASVDPAALVGATDWCTHPADLSLTRIRGTKNPDIRAITALAPDVVIANQEENRRIDVERLRQAGVAVWVTRIETLPEAFTSLGRMFDDALGWTRPDWLAAAESAWTQRSVMSASRRLKVIVPIWRDPWMVVGPRTFTADLLGHLGADVVPEGLDDETDGRYPSVDIERVDALGADLALLPDEPYVFTPDDGPEAFTHTPTALVSGRLLTWYGPSLVAAHQILGEVLARAARELAIRPDPGSGTRPIPPR